MSQWIITTQKSQQKRILLSRWMRWPVCGHRLAHFLSYFCLISMKTKWSVFHCLSNMTSEHHCWMSHLPIAGPDNKHATKRLRQSGGRLTTKDHFHHGKGRILFLMKSTLTLDTDLPSPFTMLPKPPSGSLQNVLFTWYFMEHCFWPYLKVWD